MIDQHPELLKLDGWLWNNSESKLRKDIKKRIIKSSMYKCEEANDMVEGYTGLILFFLEKPMLHAIKLQ